MESQARAFDLYLVDLNLGTGIDGYEVCRRLKARPQTRNIPAVLISGELTNREDLHRGYEAGCEAFLIKGDFALLEDVVRAMMRIKALQDDLALQNHLLEQQNRKLQEERQRGADLEQALRRSGETPGAPIEADATLIVGEDGVVRYADRGARDTFQKDIEGKQLGSLVQGSGLEAYVRDARTDTRGGFRFELSRRKGSSVGAFVASVVPLTTSLGGHEPRLRLVLVQDERRRRVATELVGLRDRGVPRKDLGPLLEAAGRTFHLGGVLGISPPMGELRSRMQHAVHADQPVLLTGESGTGKELIARVLHFSGPRTGPFVPLHCGTLSGRTLESELFGHMKGAHDEAPFDRPGLIQQAHTGTIYLEEVGELPLDLQERLLALLDTGRVKRSGSEQAESVNVRVIASSTRNLSSAVADGTFLPDLRERIAGIALHVPPLRERAGDVRVLAQAFLARFGAPREITAISEEAVWVMESYDWPGNVRELEACIERACSLVRGQTIELANLTLPLQDLGLRLLHSSARSVGTGVNAAPGVPFGIPAAALPSTSSRPSPVPHPSSWDLEETPISFEAYERKALIRALHETGNDKLKAAKLLKVGKSTLYRKLKRYGIR
jgi:DNA-binding NtrC family response regulator